MSASCSGTAHWSLRFVAVVFAVAISAPLISSDAAAEIPHENYDLIDSDLDLVIAMLNASIRASEDALRSFHDQDIDSAELSMDWMAAAVEPAEAILDDIDDVASSYDQLSVLIPPFSGLLEEMQSFSGLESEMLSIRDEILAVAAELNISDSDAIEVIYSIRQMNAVLSSMNETIDDMLVFASEIDSLIVDDRQPFIPNDLVELIERLRDLTYLMHEEIVELIEEGIPWQDDRSFLLLWVADADLYLGDLLSGGGYLLKNGTFVSGSSIEIALDELVIAMPVTDDDGAFSFGYAIPMDSSWLGSHGLTAEADVAGELILSETLLINISLVPTTLVLLPSNSTISPHEELEVEAILTCDRGAPLPGAECVLTVDGESLTFSTDDNGSSVWTWSGEDLGIATHTFSADYPGVLPYAPCESGEVLVTVDLPTAVDLNLFSDRLRKGFYLVGDGTLTGDASTPLGGQRISLLIDGVNVTNVSTDSTGKFAFSIDTAEIDVGAHVLTALFVANDPYWRDSDARDVFVIVSLTYSDYPFFPWIPGWDIGGGLEEQIPYLFFGEYAYFTWLFILLVVGTVIKALQVRRKRSLITASSESVSSEGERPAHVWRDKAFASFDEMPDWLKSPNERIIWHYHSLLAFFRARGRMGITDDMTHWEVARLLGSLGYPQGEASRVAFLYEMAQYSGSESSEEDALEMGSSSASLRRSGGVRPAL